ncbi:glycosyltransferase [Lacinutrix mariniflava]|uniref:glycosyltransferase n=1 Tax=Lacinutrix mariniflava TaxID=342955 RepID=UPI0006E4529B|nr:glycosyltransferase [Lacinutrix mariniflava]
MIKPLVSIAVLTYNHEQFIAQAIDSFLAQETTFDFEIVIGDDASTDNTQKILKAFQEKNPNKFNITYHKKNIGMVPNFVNVINSCKGKYIAFCEGDDFMLDTKKLEIQASFLETNSDYAICFHEAKIYDQTKLELIDDNITSAAKEDYNLDDFSKGNFMHTPTVMIRNDFTLPEAFSTLPIGDWPLYVSVLKDRKIKKLKKVMSVYRVHEKSSWSSKSEVFRWKTSVTVINYILDNIALSDSQQKGLKRTKRKFKKKIFDSKYSLFLYLKKKFKN